MRLFCFVKFWKFITVTLVAISVIIVVFVVYDYRRLPEGSVRKFNRQNEPYDIGPLEIGGEIPYGPGETTFAPYLKIPVSQKFYVSVAEKDTWCINDDCYLEGAFIQTMGGWLQVEDIDHAEVGAMFGLDLPENKDVKSLVLVGDNQGRIVGIYPNKGLSDVIDILKNYPNLVDFNLLSGVNGFGLLKVGEPAPLKPGDSLPYLSNELSELSGDLVANVPKEKDFYIYALQKRKYDIVGMDEKYENKYICLPSGCRYPEPDPPHDFLFADIDELNGWFLANSIEDGGIIEMFGMQPEEVLSGKTSLVVVTDRAGVILVLHPGKTLSDMLTILSQIPEVASTTEWRKSFMD